MDEANAVPLAELDRRVADLKADFRSVVVLESQASRAELEKTLNALAKDVRDLRVEAASGLARLRRDVWLVGIGLLVALALGFLVWS